MEAVDIIMIAGLALMIASLVLMYRCARRRSTRMEAEELDGFLASGRADFEYKLWRFDSLLGKWLTGMKASRS